MSKKITVELTLEQAASAFQAMEYVVKRASQHRPDAIRGISEITRDIIDENHDDPSDLERLSIETLEKFADIFRKEAV